MQVQNYNFPEERFILISFCYSVQEQLAPVVDATLLFFNCLYLKLVTRRSNCSRSRGPYCTACSAQGDSFSRARSLDATTFGLGRVTTGKIGKKDGAKQRPYIYIDSRRGPPVRLAWLEADCNMLGGGKIGYLK